MKISVIIPCYGVESFIGHCAESLMNQTFQDVEFLFVNDCTKDKSMEILRDVLRKHPERAHQVKIIEHNVNKGLPAARNTGLSVANGEYVFHCDGDDWVEPTMLEELYNEAAKSDSDIIWCDYFDTYKDYDNYKKEPECSDKARIIASLLSGSMKYNVWNKFVRRSLYVENEISFPESRAMGEDLTMIKLFAVATKNGYLPKAFYHYVRWNEGAMTQTWSEKKISDLKANVEDLDIFLHHHCGETFDAELAFMKLWLKFQFLLTDGSHGMYNHWKNWFPDCNEYIQNLPNANGRLKLLMWMASKEQWWFVWLHYWIVLKGFYALRYKGKKI